MKQMSVNFCSQDFLLRAFFLSFFLKCDHILHGRFKPSLKANREVKSPMKQKLMRKAAEIKSALVSKEAAMNSTETVILILIVVVIAIAVGFAIRNLVVGSDGNGGQVSNVGKKITDGIASLGSTGA